MVTGSKQELGLFEWQRAGGEQEEGWEELSAED